MDFSKISLKSVSSSNIKAIGYDPKTKTLVVEFHSGRKYAYKDVTEEVYKGLGSAASIGSFFHREIKPKYSYEAL